MKMVSAGFIHNKFRQRKLIISSDHITISIYLSHTEKKRQYCMYDETKHVYFSFFNPLKVTDELEIECLG